MIPRTTLIQIAKMIAEDIARGTITDSVPIVGDALASDAEAMLTLLDLVAKEGSKKKPNGPLLDAYGLLFGEGLQALRYGIEHDNPQAQAIIASVRERIQALSVEGTLPPELLLVLLTHFASARLDPGQELQVLMGELMEQAPPPELSSDALGALMSSLLQDFAGDIFAIHGQLAEHAMVVPEAYRMGMVVGVLMADDAAVREVATGWLLDSSAMIRRETAAVFDQAASQDHVSGTMLRRMIAVRAWLPEDERPAVDAVIKACRRKGVDMSPLVAGKLVSVMASGIDGSGSQSLFVLIKEGRKHAMASLLLKEGVGVRDAWVNHGMTKRQAEDMLEEIRFQMDMFDISIDHLQQSLGHALSVNADSGVLPPFGLVDFLETIGLAMATPEPLPDEVLLARLIDAIPARKGGPASVRRALKESAHWPTEYDFLESWFDEGPELDALLSDETLSLEQQCVLVLEQYLSSRRAIWAHRLCRVAETLRHCPQTAADWIDFALVAREVASDRPLAEIPLMTIVAALTVNVYRGPASFVTSGIGSYPV
ncbi:hypothetical protein [Insolitispirillum peregrinum]|uniref:hypothetical protein n=1 Tax=Insolitispirillum peregrinum TaxID=80876 RepID=UPI003607797D